MKKLSIRKEKLAAHPRKTAGSSSQMSALGAVN
jgi:hypothetical protein